MAFPVITKSLQEAYEQGTKGSQDKTPEICGVYGRACRQMEKAEGANRMLCSDCGLAKYAQNYPTEEELSEFEAQQCAAINRSAGTGII